MVPEVGGTEKVGVKMGFEDWITHHPAASRTPYQVVRGTQMASSTKWWPTTKTFKSGNSQRTCGEEVCPGQSADSDIWKVGVKSAWESEIAQQSGGQ